MPPNRTNGFRFNARYCLATYSQSGDLSGDDVKHVVESLEGRCVVGRENHADGGTHLHCFIDFGRKFSTRAQDFLDVAGRHPNLVCGLRTPHKMYDYATKDGDIVAESIGMERPPGGKRDTIGSKWGEIVASDTKDEFFRRARETAPRDLCCSFPAISKYAEWRYARPEAEYTTPSGLDIDISTFPELSEWVSESIVGWELGVR
jgi:hypothetical protein